MEDPAKNPDMHEEQPRQGRALTPSCCATTLNVRIPNSLLQRFSVTRTETEVVMQFQASPGQFLTFGRGGEYQGDVQFELGLVDRSRCGKTGEVTDT